MAGNYSRREALAMGSGFLAAILASPAALASFHEQTAAILAGPLPDSGPFATFDKFLALSRMLTGRSALREARAARLFPYFMEEPYGPEHIARTYAKLRAALAAGEAASVPEAIAAGALGEGETWFTHHLITTWYLGIYYHERLTGRVLYEDALIWDAVKDTVPVQGFSTWATGYWAEPPQADGGGPAQ